MARQRIRIGFVQAVVVVTVVAATLVPAYAGPAPKGAGPAWATLTPVPTRFVFSIGVEGMSVASVGNEIIAALGFDAGDTDITRIYDIASDTWSLGALAPGSSSEGAGTSHGGLFYNVGGRGAGFAALWSYNPTTDAWTVLTPMPTGRAGLAVAVVGNSIYAIGGRTSGGGAVQRLRADRSGTIRYRF